MENTYYYIGANLTGDLIIERPDGKILLAKRSPTALACPDMWAIPGGFVNTSAKKGEVFKQDQETPEQAALRELSEEVCLTLINPQLIFVGVYEGNNRDPRDNEISWTKTYAYYFKIDEQTFLEQQSLMEAKDDVVDFDWFTKDEIKEMKLAFDHNIILGDSPAFKNKFKSTI